MLPGNPLVVNGNTTALPRQITIIVNGHEIGSNTLPNAPAIERSPLPVEIRLEPVPNSLMQKHPATASPNDNGHLPSRRLTSPKLGGSDASRIASNDLRRQLAIHINTGAPAIPDITVLPLRTVTSNNLHPERNERPPI
ncbi:MAG: hypothetical protein QOD51_2293, partial [Candidatus Eremiobacteraeota bacterium]|nr:hypothetical protein [Candidatus Eremiobacteraeota bacterium]